MAAKKQEGQLSLESGPTEEPLTTSPDQSSPSARGAARRKQSRKHAGVGDEHGKSAVPELSFEGAIERLTAIVEQLEAEGQPLESSLKLFEEGIRLARQSQARLEAAEKKVEELLAYDDSGQPIVDELDSD